MTFSLKKVFIFESFCPYFTVQEEGRALKYAMKNNSLFPVFQLGQYHFVGYGLHPVLSINPTNENCSHKKGPVLNTCYVVLCSLVAIKI